MSNELNLDEVRIIFNDLIYKSFKVDTIKEGDLVLDTQDLTINICAMVNDDTVALTDATSIGTPMIVTELGVPISRCRVCKMIPENNSLN